ncbi:hypothetical protein Golob_027995 [Gossypium lobatum]|uniref:Uncharacterized protein n=1 Tax=Gossypium lobatum TaxID=34289 RepID=A0A7J8NCV0_9ROSI|nr:hypothetical protein [Gossypium lobatum]
MSSIVRKVVMISSFLSLHELSARGCKELVDEGSSSAKEVTSLKSVSLSYISKFNISTERIMLRFASSEYFNIYGWKELGSLSQTVLGLVGHRFFTVEDCPQLISVETEDERLQLDKILGVESLVIRDCERLNQLPEVLHAFTFLTRMRLEKGCPLLECIAQDFDETTDLESIYISDALNIKSFPRGLDKLIHLQEIELAGCSSLVWFEESGFPATNLLVLLIFKCENFGAIPKCIHNFTSLQKLEVWKCSADMSFPEEGFPTNLTSLEISNGPKMYTSLVEWGLNKVTSTQELNIGGEGCSRVVSFPEQGIGRMLPPSLTSICI